MTKFFRLFAVVALAAALGACGDDSSSSGATPSSTPNPDPAPTELTYATLMKGQYRSEVDLSQYAPPADADAPTQTFEGTLHLSGQPGARMVYVRTGFVSRGQIAAAGTFPTDFNFEFVQVDDVLLPVRRGYVVTDHPYWDFVLLPGRVWNESADHGYTRASLPFALVQKHMNCTHYGVMMFLFRSDGSISDVAMQISSETCMYLHVDMWGLLDATYSPHPVSNGKAVIEAYRQNQSHRLPEKPIAQLAKDYPAIDPAELVIGESNARTLYGLVVNGVNYVSACPTRYGDYPYCGELPFPSYSLAKSAEAALALMAMEQSHPGAKNVTVDQFAPVPGCAMPGWNDVTLKNLLNMTSGHYDSAAFEADEGASKVGNFFSATTEHDKAAFSCNAYPRVVAPGTTWVYHTSDIFLLGDVLNRYLQSLPGEKQADIFSDVVDAKIYKPLHLSAAARATRRTADNATQPFFGYGLQFNRDDIARLALFVDNGNGKIDGHQVLDPQMLKLALQRVDGQRGYTVTGHPNLRYQFGYWARDVAPLLSCDAPTWVPFMSGFGGISVVLYPNGAVYYNVSDSGSAAAFDWGKTALQANKAGGYCQ